MVENLTAFISFLQSILIPKVDFTVLDLLLIVVFIFYAFEGYSVGFIQALIDLVSFVLSFFIGIGLYGPFAKMLDFLAMPIGIAKAGSFFIICAISQAIISRLLRLLGKRFITGNTGVFGKLNKILGIIPSLFSASVLLSFLLTLVLSLPISPFLKHAISSSKIAGTLVLATSSFEKNLNAIFGGAVEEGITFLSIEPKSNETVKLHFSTTKFQEDKAAEGYMLSLVNKERQKSGLPPLVADADLSSLARDHDKDMFVRGYFSHYTPEGLTPFDRMAKANISFSQAGENLALAPNTDIAMQGLMASPGHRANILSSEFHRIGIGVLDGGAYGEMFAQEFTD